MTRDSFFELTLMLRPAGGGVHTVSTGRSEQIELQRRLYGVTTLTEPAPAIDANWRGALERVASARVVILAIPSDTGAGLVRGAAFGPAALRTRMLELLPDFPERAHRAGVVDVGDVFVVPQLLSDDMVSEAQLAATRAAIYSTVPGVSPELAARLPVAPLSIAAAVMNRLLDLNPDLKFLVMGGDHSVTWPAVSTLAARRSRPFAIVHPDAHTDLLPERLGIKVCFATWAYHANELIGRGGRLVQVGVRASRHPREHWESTLGVRQFWAEDIAQRGESQVLDAIVEHLRAIGVGDVYLSNDIDATDAAAAPATGAPEGRGLSVAFVRALIARLAAEVSIIGADLVEVAPTIGGPEGSQRTVDVGARYVLDSLAALSGEKEFVM